MQELPDDKLLHIQTGFALGFLILLFGVPFGWMISAIMLLGALKEGIDLFTQGTPDLWDFIASVIGGALAYPILHWVVLPIVSR